MTWALVVLPTLLFLFGFPIFVVLAASAAMFLLFSRKRLPQAGEAVETIEAEIAQAAAARA